MPFENRLNLLYLEDDEDHAFLFMETLAEIAPQPPLVTHKTNLQAGVEAVTRTDFDAVILDLGLPECQGHETLARFIRVCPHIPIIVLTTNDDWQLSIEAIKTGAQDFLIKGEITASSIMRSLRYAIERFEILNELEQKNESLNTFAIAASHDLKTPLHNILLTLDAFKREHYESALKNDLNALDVIQESVGRLYELIDSLMEFTNAETKLSASGFFQANQCIEETLARYVLEIQEQHIKIVVQDNMPRIVGNYRLLLRVFLNLLDNAIKYTDKQTPEIHISAMEAADEVIFQICDNGIGIAKQYHERIFEPLRRLHTQQEYPGSGIGLAICKRIVTAHGGRIWVESKAGEGSTFFVALPKVKDQPAAAA